MNIIIEGTIGNDPVVIVGKTLFGMNMEWLRRMTTVPARKTRFKNTLTAANSFNQIIDVPGPIRAVISAQIVEQVATVRLDLLPDDDSTIVWSRTVTVGVEPVPFTFRIGKFRIEGLLTVVE